jgi:iron complex outermembrane receptor protein
MDSYIKTVTSEQFRSVLRIALIVILLMLSTAILAQRSVTGRVVDEADGFGIPGASVVIKGTTQGTVTDFDGNYRLSVPEEGATLVVSFVGYVSTEVETGNRSVIDISLSVNVQQLQEVVVVGYGTVEKGDVTGVVATVDEELFNNGMIASPDQLLNGKVAGVSITSTNGEPGGQVRVRIRGGTSITASNEPLFVIDGVPIDNSAHNPGGFAQGRNPLNFLNPNDIENMTVLKDASAAAIYGSRGANGVIIITTKSGGQTDKPQVTYDFSYGVTEFFQDLPILSPSLFRQAMEIYGSRNLGFLEDAQTDWFEEITQTANSQQHNFSVSGGIEDGGYRFSAGYQNIDGILKSSNTQRTNLNFNFNKSLLDNSLQVKFGTKNAVTNDIFASNQVGAAFTMAPTQPIFDEESEFGGYYEWDDQLAVRNPVAEINEREQIGENFRSISNAELRYSLPFLEGFSIQTNFAFDTQRGERRRYSPSFLKSEENNRGSWALERFTRESFLFESFGEYKFDLPSIDSDITVLGGYSYQDFNSSFPSFSVDSLSTDLFGINTPAVGDGSIIRVNNPILENRLVSFYGRVNASIMDKYVFTATLRRDGSTRFGPDNRWGVFPSFAAGWRITNEQFMSGVTGTLNYLKLRLGWGLTGSQEIGDYRYIAAYDLSGGQAQYQFGGSFFPVLRPEGVDPNLKWEETSSLNIGADYELFDGKIAGSIEYYQKDTRDLLFTIAFPAGSVLADRILTNIGELQNKGVEFEISSPVVNTNDLQINIGFNAAFNRNEIKKLDNTVIEGSEENVVYEVGNIAGDVGQTIQLLQVGQPINSFYVLEHKYDESGAPIYDGTNLLNMYVDRNEDGIINEDDKRPLEDPAPDWILGFTNTANYKNFDFSMTWRSNIGNYVYNNVSSNTGNFQRLNDRVPNNIHESALETNFFFKQILSDYYIENGSFLKLDNLTVGYTYTGLDWARVRLYATGTNLLLITGYTGLDPEIPDGLDNNLYPRSTTFIGGISVTF